MEKEYLNVIDQKYDPLIHGDYEGDFERNHFSSTSNTSNTSKIMKWDDFQIHSYQAIKRGDNLLVVAPTSSGKTSVAKYATLFNLIEKGVRVVYTTPIKTLSNEKYEEMKQVLEPYGIMPGLLTGDQKINTDSMFIIMTAEILANALFLLKKDNQTNDLDYQLNKEFVSSVGCVVIDEIHFISDNSRGYIWEQTLILLDRSVQIIGLSATIDTPEDFAAWIGRIKQRNITLVKKYDRPVPLEYAIFDGEKHHIILNTEGVYDSKAFHNASIGLKETEKHHSTKKTNKVNALLNDFVRYSQQKDLLQLCFIVFSKKNCEVFANSINVILMDKKESTLAIRELDKKMGTHLKNYENMPRYRQIRNLIEKGICFHHAGLPVILKEVIEKLYKEGYIKVLFATETVAIGVNMPIRTLVLTSIDKSVGTNIQQLNAAEFKQICGRAGRRGLDKKGLIVFLPLYDTLNELHLRNELLFGPMPKISSKMELTYHSYLKLLESNVMNYNTFFDNSLLSIQNSKILSGIMSNYNECQKKYDDANIALEKYISQNNISKNIINSINEYITNINKRSVKIAGVDMHMKMNKQQQQNHKRLEGIVKSNKILFDMTLNVDKCHNELIKADNEKKYYLMYRDDRSLQITEYLRTSGYLTDNNEVTEYGKMVAYVNECNPFVLAEVFTGNILQSMNPKQIACLLSILTDKITKTNKDEKTLSSIKIDPIVKDGIMFIEDRIKNYTDLEHEMKLFSEMEYWDVSYDYIEITNLWVNTDLEIEDHTRILTLLNDIDEYEGSFIKNMLKINNIVGNLVTLCNLTQQLDILPKLNDVTKLLVKGMVNADSLHVIQ